MNNQQEGYTFTGTIVSIPEFKLSGKNGDFKVQDFIVAERVERTVRDDRPQRNGFASNGGWARQSQVEQAQPSIRWINPVRFTLKGQDADAILAFKVGDKVVVSFDLVGRLYKDSVFVELIPFAMDYAQPANPQAQGGANIMQFANQTFGQPPKVLQSESDEPLLF